MSRNQRFAPSLLDKLADRSLNERPGEVLPGLSLQELKDSVAADLEAMLNARSLMDPEDRRRYPLASRSIVNFGIVDFSSRSLTSNADRSVICQSIGQAIENQDSRLRSVEVSLAENNSLFNRMDFVIRATLVVSDAGENVSFNARFEPNSQRYSVAQGPVRRTEQPKVAA